MNQILTDVVQVILIPAIPVATAYLVKFLAAHISAKKLETVYREVMAVVDATEQMANSGQIDKGSKLDTAFATLRELFPRENEIRLRQYIEQQVLRNKNWGLSLTSPAPVETPATTPVIDVPVAEPVQETPVEATPLATI